MNYNPFPHGARSGRDRFLVIWVNDPGPTPSTYNVTLTINGAGSTDDLIINGTVTRAAGTGAGTPCAICRSPAHTTVNHPTGSGTGGNRPPPIRLLDGHQTKWVPIVFPNAGLRLASDSISPTEYRNLRLSTRMLGARSTPLPRRD